jgi:hypothetical protein
MEDETGNNCPSCAATVKEGTAFCTKCGVALTRAAGAAAAASQPGEPPPPTSGETPPAPPPGAPQQGMAAAAPPPAPPASAAPKTKHGKAPLILGIIGGVLVVGGIVVLVLYLAVWSGNGGEGGTNQPVALAQKYMNALEYKDAAAYVDCIDARYFEDIGLTLAEAEAMVEGYFMMLDVDFKEVELEVKDTRKNYTVVVTTGGTLEINSLDYSEDIDLAGDPMYFYTFEQGGRWYLEDDPMDQVMGPDIGYEDGGEYDFNLEDFNLEDLEQLELDIEELERMLEDMDIEELEKILEDMDIEELREWLKQFEDGEVPTQV